jgi:putative acetyltransferase
LLLTLLQSGAKLTKFFIFIESFSINKSIMTDIFIRKETSDDFETIKKVNNLAFNQKQEGILIENLRKKTEFVPELSLVAILKNKIIGHILYFPITIVTGKNFTTTLCLAPMAVLPGYQKKGVGGALIKEGLLIAKELGFNSVIVLGHPEYYPRFGFRKASEWKLKEPFGVPEEVIMAIELKEGGLGFGGGMIDFPEEYYAAM